MNVTQDSGNYWTLWFPYHTSMRAHLWWLCGDMKLRPRLPSAWHGSCTLTQILMPFHLFPTREFRNLGSKLHPSCLQCYKWWRAAGGSFDGSVYVDSFGVPRGVPNEFKTRNQVEAGFESFLFWWVTINKNVDCWL